MFTSLRQRRALTLGALTMAGVLAPVAGAYGQATPVRFSNPPEPFVEQFGPGDDLCFASGGQFTGTDTTSGIHFQTDQAFHLSIHNVRDYTIRYDDPSLPVYTGRAIDDFSFQGQLTDGSDTIAATDHVTDRATGSDGSSVLVHETVHGTVLDTEPPDPSPGDIVRVEFDHLRVSCPR